MKALVLGFWLLLSAILSLPAKRLALSSGRVRYRKGPLTSPEQITASIVDGKVVLLGDCKDAKDDVDLPFKKGF